MLTRVTSGQTTLHPPTGLYLAASLVALYVLTALQTAHFFEHFVQLVQVHLLRFREADANGLVSLLNQEPVHFTFNLFVFISVLLLRLPFGHNPWLQVCLPLTGWHALEHCVRLWAYLNGDHSGAGLLGTGGLILGGLPIGERFLHFLFNGAEVLLLVPALLWQARRRERSDGPRAGKIPQPDHYHSA